MALFRQAPKPLQAPPQGAKMGATFLKESSSAALAYLAAWRV
jgi:hypothetical protein